MRPDCLLGVVPQPTDSRLSETSARTTDNVNRTVADVVAPNDTPVECVPLINRPSSWVTNCLYNELLVKVERESPASPTESYSARY